MSEILKAKINTYTDEQNKLSQAQELLRIAKEQEQVRELDVLNHKLTKVITPIQGGYKIKYK